MKDEWNNECPYDFKNIMFKRISTIVYDQVLYDSILDLYPYWATTTYIPTGLGLDDEEDFIWVYTFYDCIYDEDASLRHHEVIPDTGGYENSLVFNNCIKSYYVALHIDDNDYSSVLALNNIVFYFRVIDNETVGYGIYDNVFEGNCHEMTLSKKCFGNVFDNSCHYNTFGNSCSDNIFSNDCSSNTFGNHCDHNTFGNDCHYNIFSNDCSSNTFGNDCHYNTLGCNCDHNTFGNACDHNAFRNHCSSNTFGNDCEYNTIKDENVNCNIFEDTVSYVNLKGNGGSGHLQNITIRQGIQGTYGNRIVITEPRGLTHDVTYRAAGAEDKTI